jgi:hypothetical protein
MIQSYEQINYVLEKKIVANFTFHKGLWYLITIWWKKTEFTVMIFFINVVVRVSLDASRLISHALNLTIM